jgi:hypothetical protein
MGYLFRYEFVILGDQFIGLTKHRIERLLCTTTGYTILHQEVLYGKFESFHFIRSPCSFLNYVFLIVVTLSCSLKGTQRLRENDGKRYLGNILTDKLTNKSPHIYFLIRLPQEWKLLPRWIRTTEDSICKLSLEILLLHDLFLWRSPNAGINLSLIFLQFLNIWFISVWNIIEVLEHISV